MRWESSGRGSTGSGPYTLASSIDEDPAGFIDTSSWEMSDGRSPSRRVPRGVSTHVGHGTGSWLALGEAVMGTVGTASGKRGCSGPPNSASGVLGCAAARSGLKFSGKRPPFGRLPRRDQ